MDENDPAIKHELEAIQKFILRSVIPLLQERSEGKPDPVGTGTLLAINDRRFIVTAKHVFGEDAADLQQVAIPDAIEGTNFVRIMKMNYGRPKGDGFDVAILEIADAESIAAIEKRWSFLTLDNVNPNWWPKLAWVTGYPSSRATVAGKILTTMPVTIMTEKLAEVPDNLRYPAIRGLDMFYLYNRTARLLWKGEAGTPPLPGISGAAIWAVTKPDVGDQFWTPAKSAKMIGVQVSYDHDRFIRGQTWLAVAKIFALMDDEISNAVKEKLGVERDAPPSEHNAPPMEKATQPAAVSSSRSGPCR
ncbi:hypothetical protein [Phreatobacter sp.]|uniref:hypothetical protein n=1 Tax=Phreatobacter sp. TaxID=1966341 RepID=UPI003F6FD1DC